MAGESQQAPTTEPDPSVLTTEQMLLSVSNLEELTRAHREGAVAAVNAQLDGMRQELLIRESYRLEQKADADAHRLELKADAKEALTAALAAAEKVREQQTVASALATDKTENQFAERVRQQGDTFTLAIAALTTGLDDIKSAVGEIRSERKGGLDLARGIAALAGFILAMLLIGGIVIAAWPR